MINLLFFSNVISIQIATWIFVIENGLEIKIIINFLDDCMQLSDTHTTDFNIIMSLGSPLSDFSQLHVYSIVYFSAKLRILVQISYVRFIYVYGIKDLIFLLNLFLLVFGYLIIILLLWDKL